MTLRGRVVISIAIAGCCALAVAYHVLDLREPRHARAQMDAFRKNAPGAWDDYKMDPPRSSRAVPALLEGLRDKNATVRERAVWGICGLSWDPEIIAALRAVAQDSNREARKAARSCLKGTYRFGPNGEPL
jgi:hypothetical protein